MKKRVLIVEDEPAIASVLQQILTADAFSVDVVQNGNLACDRVHEQTYDLVISNIHLPGMNGMQFFQFLKKERPELSTKTLFITGDILGEDTKAFLEESNCPYLLKPFTPGELKTAIENIANSL